MELCPGPPDPHEKRALLATPGRLRYLLIPLLHVMLHGVA